MQILPLLLAAPNSCKFRGEFVFVHLFPQIFSSFQIAHSVEREGLVWKVMGSSPSEVIVPFSSRLQLIGSNNAANSFWINSLCSCKVCSLKLQIYKLRVAAIVGCKYCIQLATGRVTQLIVAIFATKIFAVCTTVSILTFLLTKTGGEQRVRVGQW